MVKALLLSAAYGWFAGLLTVMVVVTALFALILFIALKPIKKDELDDSSSAKKALGRRETELTIALLNKQNDEKKRAELEGQLREVKSAERLVEELMPEEESAAVTKSTPAKGTKPAPKAQPKPAPKAQPAQDKPAPKAQPKNEAPAEKPAPKAQPAQEKPAEEKKAEPQPEKKAEESAEVASEKPADKK